MGGLTDTLSKSNLTDSSDSCRILLASASTIVVSDEEEGESNHNDNDNDDEVQSGDSEESII